MIIAAVEIVLCSGNNSLSGLEKYVALKNIEQSVGNALYKDCIAVNTVTAKFAKASKQQVVVRVLSGEHDGDCTQCLDKDKIAKAIIEVCEHKSCSKLFKKPLGIAFEYVKPTASADKGSASVANVSDVFADDEDSLERRIVGFNERIIDPKYTYDQLVLDEAVLREIEIALMTLEHSEFIYEVWGLKKVDPNPRAILNFYGPPGTGKTLAAHAIADHLGKKLMIIGCPEILSKYHGESSKNVQAVFKAAERADALLFFDEADGLLSSRLAETTSGSEVAINNMRNSMLQCLEQHRGAVIFASNFVKSYDYAFSTRVQSINFSMPNAELLERIWKVIFLPAITKHGEIDFRQLAERSYELELCGRDVKNAVIKACSKALYRFATQSNAELSMLEKSGNDGMVVEEQQPYVSQRDLLEACEQLSKTREDIKKADYAQQSMMNKKEEAKTLSLEEIIKQNEDKWRNSYLREIPGVESLNIRKLMKAAHGLRDIEIRHAIINACYSAYEDGKTQVNDDVVLQALSNIQNSLVHDKSYDGNESDKDDNLTKIKNLLTELIRSERIN